LAVYRARAGFRADSVGFVRPQRTPRFL